MQIFFSGEKAFFVSIIVGPKFFDGVIDDIGKIKKHHTGSCYSSKHWCCFSGLDGLCSLSDSIQEMLFLIRAHITVTRTSTPTEDRAKPQGSVRGIDTDVVLT